MTSPSLIRGVLIDLSGTLHIGDKLVPGAIEAIERLRNSGRRVRFLTNTSAKSTSSLLSQLRGLGIDIANDGELLTSVLATRNYLIQHQLRPYCIMEDTSDLSSSSSSTGTGDDDNATVVDLSPPHNCVVIGLAPTKFEYSVLNEAFRILLKHPKLIAIHKAKYVRDTTDGELSMGPGGFCAALEMASDCSAIVMGKPSKDFFTSALWPDIAASETCMIGDDVLQDVKGAKDAGIGTFILVKTGKYRDGDENQVSDAITCASIVEATDYILGTE